MTAAEVLQEIENQLAWRGPNGGKMGHIVLTRGQAESLLSAQGTKVPAPREAVFKEGEGGRGQEGTSR
jgi:hypothetical protein